MVINGGFVFGLTCVADGECGKFAGVFIGISSSSNDEVEE